MSFVLEIIRGSSRVRESNREIMVQMAITDNRRPGASMFDIRARLESYRGSLVGTWTDFDSDQCQVTRRASSLSVRVDTRFNDGRTSHGISRAQRRSTSGTHHG